MPWRALGRALRFAGPSALTLCAVVLELVPLRLGPALVFAPDWTLCAVFVFAVLRPELLPSWSAFGAGLIKDILAGAPLGLNAFVLVAVREAARLLADPLHGQPFVLGWFCFAIVALAAQLVSALLVVALTGSLIAARPATALYAYTVFAYPLAHVVLRRLSRGLVGGI